MNFADWGWQAVLILSGGCFVVIIGLSLIATEIVRKVRREKRRNRRLMQTGYRYSRRN
jgi:hypothetical protein